MRYTYIGDRFTAPEIKRMQCDPVRREDGKCRRSRMGTMLVTDGSKNYIIIARLLRINKKH
ncbi:MAG TPA: hypothetical protein ENH85_06900 [Candidatus Scalindua sp.]|nr:hypothetical protein [Candidatus Scalindua sp.]